MTAVKNVCKTILALVILIILFSGCSQKSQITSIKNGVVVSNKNFSIKIQFYTNNSVRIQKWTSEGSDEKKSLVVIMDSIPNLNIKITEGSNEIWLESDNLKVKIRPSKTKVEFFSKIMREFLVRINSVLNL